MNKKGLSLKTRIIIFTCMVIMAAVLSITFFVAKWTADRVQSSVETGTTVESKNNK